MKTKRMRGQALIEFALIIPLVILLFTVVIDIGRAMFLYSALANAVREGTRYAIVNPVSVATNDEIKTRVKNYSTIFDPDEVVVDEPTYDSTTGYIFVIARYQYKPITPGLSAIIGSGNHIELEAHSRALMAPLYRPD